MSSLLLFVKDFLDRDDGTTAVEYAAALSVMMLVGVATITALGGNLNKKETSHSAVRRVDRFPIVNSAGVFEFQIKKSRSQPR